MGCIASKEQEAGHARHPYQAPPLKGLEQQCPPDGAALCNRLGAGYGAKDSLLAEHLASLVEGKEQRGQEDVLPFLPLLLQDENARSTSLHKLQILDSEPEEAYDNITKLCTTIFKVPVSMITFVDDDRVWIKSKQGTAMHVVARKCSICSWVIATRYPELLYVEDCREDRRFCNTPVVAGPPFVRFYAGSPLVLADGQKVGTICIIDSEPRQFGASDMQLLAQMGHLVVREVEQRTAQQQELRRSQDKERRRRSFDAAGVHLPPPELAAGLGHAPFASPGTSTGPGIMLLNMMDVHWPIMLVNDAWQRISGAAASIRTGTSFWDVYQPLTSRQVDACLLAVEQQRNFELRLRPRLAYSTDGSADSSSGSDCGGGAAALQVVQFRSCNRAHGLEYAPMVGLSPLVLPKQGSQTYYFAVLLPMVSEPAPDAAASSLPDTAAANGLPKPRSAGRLGLNQPEVSVRAWSESDASTHSSSGGPGSSSTTSTPSTAASTTPGHSVASHGSSSTRTSATPSHENGSFSLLLDDATPLADVELGPLLGRGSFGRVHQAFWNGCLVAVKVLDALEHDPNTGSTLEALLHTQLSHPGVVKVYQFSLRDVGMCDLDGRHLQEVWMVMEFCDRGTLSDAILRGWLHRRVASRDQSDAAGEERWEPNLEYLLGIACEVASAMAYLHCHNVLHGDLTGNNVMLTSSGGDGRMFSAKVADFGVARIVHDQEEHVQTQTHGTVTHMAPEVLQEHCMSKAADVYSFGVVLWEMWCGRPAFVGMGLAQVLNQVLHGCGLEAPPSAPEGFRKLVGSCLARNPAARPTFSEVQRTIRQLLPAAKA